MQFFTDTGSPRSVPPYFRAIDLRHHLDGECQSASVASVQHMLNFWSAVIIDTVTAKGAFLLSYLKVY